MEDGSPTLAPWKRLCCIVVLIAVVSISMENYKEILSFECNVMGIRVYSGRKNYIPWPKLT